jgi:putative transposase
VRAELIDQGIRVSGKRVPRLMRVNASRGISRRSGFIVTARRNERERPAPDLLKREFIAGGPYELRVADMTYVPTSAGGIVLDACSWRFVDWPLASR